MCTSPIPDDTARPRMIHSAPFKGGGVEQACARSHAPSPAHRGRAGQVAALTSLSAIVFGLFGMMVLPGPAGAAGRRGRTAWRAHVRRPRHLPRVRRRRRHLARRSAGRRTALAAAAAGVPGGRLRRARRAAGGRSTGPAAAAERVQRVTDLVPQYVQLVEAGWRAAREGRPVARPTCGRRGSWRRTRSSRTRRTCAGSRSRRSPRPSATPPARPARSRWLWLCWASSAVRTGSCPPHQTAQQHRPDGRGGAGHHARGLRGPADDLRGHADDGIGHGSGWWHRWRRRATSAGPPTATRPAC